MLKSEKNRKEWQWGWLIDAMRFDLRKEKKRKVREREREGSDLARAITNFRGGLGGGVFPREKAPGCSREKCLEMRFVVCWSVVEITREHVERQRGSNADFGNAVLCNRQKQGNEPQKHQLCQCSADHEFK